MLFCLFANSQSIRDVSNVLCSDSGNLDFKKIKEKVSELYILKNKWGYSYQTPRIPCDFIPTTIGNSTDIFKGSFGNVTMSNQGGSIQGYFSSLPSNSKILATDKDGKPTLLMDCNTLN